MSLDSTTTCRIKADNLVVSYEPTIALDLPSLSLEGNAIALIGHNGAGKSTFIKTMLGLLEPSRGSYSLSLINQGNSMPLVPNMHMAFCPEGGAIFSDISVESYIRLWCRVKIGQASYYKKEGSRIIEMLHLTPLLGKLGRELSKGQRRRVQTAIGFLTRPKLFLIDEPFCGLDVQRTNELSTIISQMSSQMSFLIASHRMEVVERLADCVLVLRNGQIVAAGSVSHVAKALCSQTVKISHASECNAIVRSLREHFPQSIVTRLGDEIAISGNGLDLGNVHGLVKSIDSNGAVVQTCKTSLVDALNYHLYKERSDLRNEC